MTLNGEIANTMDMYDSDWKSEPSAESVLLQQILDEVLEIKARMDKVESMTATVIAEVKPTLDEVLNSSFMKMLGVKKKN